MTSAVASTIRQTSTGDASAWFARWASGRSERGSVLIHSPSHVFQAPGGGENQLVRTALELETLGVPVRPFSPWLDRIDDARLLHLFGMSREGLELARVAQSKGVPVVLSTICWYDPRSLWALASSRSDALLSLSKWAMQRALRGRFGWRRALLGLADAVLPNSRAEARQLVTTFGANPETIHVVPNGVEERFAWADPSLFVDRHGSIEFVLYVGRIEPRKNVLGLIEATRVLNVPLVLIGDAPPGFDSYQTACEAAGAGLATWYSAVSHDDPFLASAYAAARVVALPSWFETPGLAALEAAIAGRAVVVTPYGAAREYFGEDVEYARPDHPREVVRALSNAWHNGPCAGLAARLRTHYLWSEVARRTAEVYDRVAR